jgi:hypothetical protein
VSKIEEALSDAWYIFYKISGGYTVTAADVSETITGVTIDGSVFESAVINGNKVTLAYDAIWELGLTGEKDITFETAEKSYTARLVFVREFNWFTDPNHTVTQTADTSGDTNVVSDRTADIAEGTLMLYIVWKNNAVGTIGKFTDEAVAYIKALGYTTFNAQYYQRAGWRFIAQKRAVFGDWNAHYNDTSRAWTDVIYQHGTPLQGTALSDLPVDYLGDNAADADNSIIWRGGTDRFGSNSPYDFYLYFTFA